MALTPGGASGRVGPVNIPSPPHTGPPDGPRGPAALPVRPLTPADLPDIIDVDAAAFGQDVPRDFLDEVILPWLELDRFVGARDPEAGGELVAIGCILSKSLTFPGGAVHPVAGVSWVAVRPGWRRRGLLRGMMQAQLHGLHGSGGESVAILTASEGALYGRFGYGRAIQRTTMAVPHGVAFRPGVAVEPVRQIRAAAAPAIVKPLYARVAGNRPGYLTRSDEIWSMRFSDHQEFRGDASKKQWAVHRDGYVSYRVKPGWNERGPNSTLQVDEICAANPVAYASLWRFLADLDLTREIHYSMGWVDDPLQDLLLDPRAMTTSPRDHLWLRLVDLDRAVGLRGYTTPALVRVEVVDDFCPWNAGTWLFDLGPDGGRVTRTAGAAQLRIDIRDLGACFLGGTPLGRLLQAGLVDGEPDAALSLAAALATPAAPWCPEGF
jgi:predicted acetyltransferase